jgi:hypothetical protein
MGLMRAATLHAGSPVTRQYAREQRRLDVSCRICHHAAVLDVDGYADDVPVPLVRPAMVCTRCGIVGADARPELAGCPYQSCNQPQR